MIFFSTFETTWALITNLKKVQRNVPKSLPARALHDIRWFAISRAFHGVSARRVWAISVLLIGVDERLDEKVVKFLINLRRC